VAVLSAPYLIVLLAFGQIDAVLLWLAAESLWGVAALFKPPFVLVGLLHAWKRQWRIVTIGTVTLALGLSMSCRQIFSWVSLVADTTASRYCSMSNQGVFGIACQYFGPRYTLPIALVIAALVLGAFALYARTDATRSAAAFYLTAFLTPLGWRANLLALIPSLFILVARRSKVLVLPVLAVILNYDLIGERAFYAFLQWRFLGFVGLAVALTTPIGSSAARDQTVVTPR